MRRCQNQCCRSINRIDPRRKHFDRLDTCNVRHRKLHPRAHRLPNPVPLHGDDPVRPAAFQQFQIVQQLLRIRRGLQKPLLDLPHLHQRIFMSPAISVDHLLVREHRAAFRTPVHPALLPVRQPALQHSQEKPLIPPVIFRLARGNLPPPVVAEPKAPQHFLKLGNVLIGPGPRVSMIFDRRVFRRQPERVPPHRVQDVKPAHPLHSRHHIPNRVVAHVSHVQRARWIRQHFQCVVFWFGRIRFGFERSRFFPALLPLRFDRLWVVVRQLAPLLYRPFVTGFCYSPLLSAFVLFRRFLILLRRRVHLRRRLFRRRRQHGESLLRLRRLVFQSRQIP
jgi:hypothetical protein